MKKSYSICAIVAVAAIAMGFTSCDSKSEAPETPETTLVGAWSQANPDVTGSLPLSFTLFADGEARLDAGRATWTATDNDGVYDVVIKGARTVTLNGVTLGEGTLTYKGVVYKRLSDGYMAYDIANYMGFKSKVTGDATERTLQDFHYPSEIDQDIDIRFVTSAPQAFDALGHLPYKYIYSKDGEDKIWEEGILEFSDIQNPTQCTIRRTSNWFGAYSYFHY